MAPLSKLTTKNYFDLSKKELKSRLEGKFTDADLKVWRRGPGRAGRGRRRGGGSRCAQYVRARCRRTAGAGAPYSAGPQRPGRRLHWQAVVARQP